MSKKQPVLSISLLSSDRGDTIRKCLDSLKPIMEQVESELVIVDTSKTKKLRKILEEYTDKIVDFEWCNDFSKARNAGLKQATGEWFLFIDDDEWFLDSEEIIDFFRSGEYRDYGMACYIVRNYGDKKGSIYKDTWASRMIKLEKDTHFESSIHEYMVPLRGKYKRLYATAAHFGYAFESEEERYRHSERNVSLLLDKIREERGNLRWWTHLVQEYQAINEYRKMEEACLEACGILEGIDDLDCNITRGELYCGCIRAQLAAYRNEEAEKFYERVVKDKRNACVAQARLYAYGAEIYFQKGKYAACEECCEKYLKLYEEFKDDVDTRFRQEGLLLTDTFREIVRNSVCSWLICCRIREKDDRALRKYFDIFEWKKEGTLTLNTVLIPSVLDGMAELAYDEYYVTVADTMINRKGPDREIIRILREKEKEKPEEFEKLVRIFAQVNHPHYYIAYIKIRDIDFRCRKEGRAPEGSEREELQACYERIFAVVADIFSLDESMWEIAKRYEIDLEPLWLAVGFDQWKKGVDTFCESTSLDTLDKISQVVERVKKQEDRRYGYFEFKAAEARLVYGAGRESAAKLRGLLRDYIKRCMAFYGYYFKETAFEGEMELLPASCRLAVRLGQVLQLEEGLGAPELTEKLRGCEGVFPSLDNAIEQYLTLCLQERKEAAERRAEAAKEAACEMQELAVQIKEKIRLLLEAGNVAEAKEAAESLKSYFPEDAELDELEQKIRLRLC